MSEGGCACGNLRFTYSGDPSVKALCHCVDCRKITGSTFSTNIAIDGGNVKITKGKPKTWTKTADSGRDITSHFCGDCGSTLFRTGEAFGKDYVIKVGVMDDMDALDNAKPALEFYAPERVSWVNNVPGTQELKGMPS